jgi:hypothetical protein
VLASDSVRASDAVLGFLVAGGLYYLVTPGQAGAQARQPVTEAVTE